jgi:hypothetical protein
MAYCADRRWDRAPRTRPPIGAGRTDCALGAQAPFVGSGESELLFLVRPDCRQIADEPGDGQIGRRPALGDRLDDAGGEIGERHQEPDVSRDDPAARELLHEQIQRLGFVDNNGELTVNSSLLKRHSTRLAPRRRPGVNAVHI